VPYSEKLVHRTKTNVLVRSKSEVVVANILTSLGISYEYEKPLEFAPNDFRLPDFTIRHQGKVFYREHFGMLGLTTYRDWMRKKAWYEAHGLLDNVVTSQEDPDGGIDSIEIEGIARTKIVTERVNRTNPNTSTLRIQLLYVICTYSLVSGGRTIPQTIASFLQA
jgi:hypothetical protein